MKAGCDNPTSGAWYPDAGGTRYPGSLEINDGQDNPCPGATNYQLVRSNVASTSGTFTTDATVPASGQAFFYLVRSRSPWLGSWGVNSAGAERILSCP